MRKITSFFAMALLLAGFTTARADVLEELQLANSTVGVGEAVSYVADLDASKWYVMYQNRTYNGYTGGYAWDKSYQDETVSTFYISENGTYAIASDGTTTLEDAAQYMVRFVSTDTDGVFYVQFGTGKYLGQLASETTNSQSIPPVTTTDEAAKMHIYNINGESTYVAFNFVNSDGTDGLILDNNGPGRVMAPWGTGEVTATTGNNAWIIYEVGITTLSEDEAALQYAQTTYSTYEAYIGTIESSSTGEPGTCDSTLVAAFEAAVAQLETMDEYEYTADELNALADAVIAAYDAAIDSRASYAATVADGYYFIQTSSMFYETVEDAESGTSSTVYSRKGMYSALDGAYTYARWMTPDGTAPFLWKVTAAGDKTYKLENMGTDAFIDSIATSSAVTMSATIDTTVCFDYSNTTNDTIYYNIRVSGAAERDYYYAHCSGHSSGAGTSGSIVGWCNTYSSEDGPMASEWTLVPVSDEEAAAIIAAYEDDKNVATRVADAEAMIAEVEPLMEIAEDAKLATAATLTSPHSDSSEGVGDYAPEVALLDGDASTFWHSDWHGATTDDHHYLQVECSDSSIPECFVFEFTRRSSSTANQITSWAIYGTNDADAATDCSTCELLTTLDTEYDSSNMTMTSDPIDNTGLYKYLRFQCTATNTSTNSKFFHLAEFQVYPYPQDQLRENSQAAQMGDTYTDLVAAIEAAEAEGDNLSVATYNTLKAAYDAFIAAYVNPDTLRTAISEAKTSQAIVVEGNNPGEWSDASVATSLSELITAATAYDAAGAYTKAQSAQYVADLEAAQEGLLAAANQVQTGKWYNLRFPTEEMYTEYGWTTSNAVSSTYPNLYNKLVGVADLELSSSSVYWNAPRYDDVAVGQGLYLVDETDLDDGTYDELVEFRFISVGDTAYMIQNRATGLFLRAAGTSGQVTLDIHPSLWTNSAMGYGKNITTGTSLSGNNENHLHAQLSGNSLVTWSSTDVNSNTGFLIEEVEDVAEDYEGLDFNISLIPGSFAAYCYPVSVTGSEYCTLYGVAVADTTITLQVYADNTAAAGQPFLIADVDNEDLYETADAEEMYPLQHGYELNVTAGTAGKLIGSYEGDTAPAGSVIASGNTLAIATEDTDIDYNSAYINAEIEDLESGLAINVTDEIWTAIKTAVANATQGGDIYSIDGTKVGTGNLSTVKSLKKGLYIVNGTKVLVK